MPHAMDDCTNIATDLRTTLCAVANAVISDELAIKDM